MKIFSKLLLITALCKLQCRASQEIIGNLAFFGRGQRYLPNYWNDIKDTKGSKDAKVYFPYNEFDESDKTDNNTDIVDNAKNHPLVLFLPGKKNRIYSNIDFQIKSEQTLINLSSFHKFKSEMKLVPPSVEDLKSDGYTCESIGLSCKDLSDYDFNANSKEWLSKVNIQLYLESEDANNEEYDDPEERRNYHYRIENLNSPTNKWSECVGDIIITNFFDSFTFTYTDFVFRNYGTMPVYIYVGNTMFLKKNPTDMVKEGIVQNNFDNWSWTKESTCFSNEKYSKDPDKKNGFKFVGITDGDSACFIKFLNGFSAPPEGISFVIHPLNDNQLKFKIHSKKEFNLTENYLIHRNCKVPIGEESEFLIDVRSIVYSDPKFLLMNDIDAYWIQSISEINKIKEELKVTKGKKYADEYRDIWYFYSFTLHHTYPEDTSKYVKRKLFEEGPECNIELETHEDWGKKDYRNDVIPVIQWPDDIKFDTIFKSKNYVETIDNDELNKETETQTNNTTDNKQNDQNSESNSIKPIVSFCLFIIELI